MSLRQTVFENLIDDLTYDPKRGFIYLLLGAAALYAGLLVSFDDRLLELVQRPRAVPEYSTLAKHLRNHFEQWFAFVFDPRIEPTNWQAEQAIRPAVVNRKVWGGNRTAAGARAQGVLMSVFETCRRQTLSVVDHVSRTLRWFGNRLLPRPLVYGQ